MKPEQRLFIFHEFRHRDACTTYLNTIPIGEGHPVMECLVRPHKKNRSLAQQALMWIWHEQKSKYFGETEAEIHLEFKRIYVLPIYLAANIQPGLYDLYKHAKERQALDDHWPLLAIYHLISTTKLKVNQMAKALTQYEQDTAMQGLAFTTLAPEYKEAMGK